ncbi:MAG TPA: FHA domain-containing protein [Anaerolineae bacterium]|nr:FHA domain-containing protein [Anaerolineae bacterium]
MLACPSCGFKNCEGMIFCEMCGAYFHTAGTLATNVLPVDPASRPGPSGFPSPDLSAREKNASLVLTSLSDNRCFVIEAGSPSTLLGRSDRKARLHVDIDLSGAGGEAFGVSRRHARTYFSNGHYMLEDLESLNGTYLNGRKLRPYLPEVLHQGDEIKLGDLALKVSFQEGPVSSPLEAEF